MTTTITVDTDTAFYSKNVTTIRDNAHDDLLLSNYHRIQFDTAVSLRVLVYITIF